MQIANNISAGAVLLGQEAATARTARTLWTPVDLSGFLLFFDTRSTWVKINSINLQPPNYFELVSQWHQPFYDKELKEESSLEPGASAGGNQRPLQLKDPWAAPPSAA